MDASVQLEAGSKALSKNYFDCHSGAKNAKFIDLFAGLGGFHQGMANAGFDCVFASELDTGLRELYSINHSVIPAGDIRHVYNADIPAHDILCAGFPCQPFSLAGSQKGNACTNSGKLIDEVLRITNFHKPRFVLLENVPKIITISNGSFWEYLKKSFEGMGYQIKHKIISPVDIGIPQNRKRVFVILFREDDDFSKFEWPDLISNTKSCSLLDYLDKSHGYKSLQPDKLEQLRHWQALLDRFGSSCLANESLVAPEFGATYPLDFGDLSLKEFKSYRGAYGVPLSNCNSLAEVIQLLPSYARKKNSVPDWIYNSILFSRNVYKSDSMFLDTWKSTLNKKNNSWQILQWRGDRKKPNIFKHLIQFRASGIRIMRADVAPSLISMTSTQIPIIGSEQRYISNFEAAKLQNLHTLHSIPTNTTNCFKAMGNAVNAKVVELLAEKLKIIISETVV